MTDRATRATLASLEQAAVERLARDLARAEDLHRAAAEVLRALHGDHDSDVAALEAARRARADAPPAALARASLAVDIARERVRSRESLIAGARRELDDAEAEVARRRHDLAQHIARRTALQREAEAPDRDDEG